MNIKQIFLQIVVQLSSIQIAYSIKSVELCNYKSEGNFKQSNWKVGEQIPLQSEKTQQFGISMWFKIKQNSIDKELFSLLNLSTEYEKRVFGIDVRIEQSEYILLPYANGRQSNLKLNYKKDEWKLVVITFEAEVFVNIFSGMNDLYSQEKIRYKPQNSFQFEEYNISITNSHQMIEFKNLFLYYGTSNQYLGFLESYILNTAIQKYDCQRIQENKKQFIFYSFFQHFYAFQNSQQLFNSNQKIKFKQKKELQQFLLINILLLKQKFEKIWFNIYYSIQFQKTYINANNLIENQNLLFYFKTQLKKFISHNQSPIKNAFVLQNYAVLSYEKEFFIGLCTQLISNFKSYKYRLVFQNIRHKCIVTLENFYSDNQELAIQNRITNIISFNLAELQLLQKNRNILLKFNNQFNLLIEEIDNQYHLLIELKNQLHLIGLIDNQLNQITLQIEINQQKQYLIQYYQNQNFIQDIYIKEKTLSKENKYKHFKYHKQFEELQIKNLILLTNFRISQSQQYTNSCLLKAIPITDNILDSNVCIFYKIKNDNILELNIESQYQKRNLASNFYIHGSNMRNIVRNTHKVYTFNTTITQVQSINTFMIFGFFKTSQINNGGRLLPVISVGEFSDVFLINFQAAIYNTTLVVLEIISVEHNIKLFSYTNVRDFTNTWVGIGLIYSKPLSSIKLLVATQPNYFIDDTAEMDGLTVQPQTLNVCINCIFNSIVLDNFEGYVSSVKIIYEAPYKTIKQFLFFNDHTDARVKQKFILSTSFNLNTFTPNSEYDLGQGFTCNSGYAFYEGICIDQNNCKTLILDPITYSSFEMGKFYDSSSNKCLNCPSNCLECRSASICTICRSSYKNQNGSCIRCNHINTCSSSCPGKQVFDPMNQMCVDTFNVSFQSLSNPLLSSRIITDNFDVVVENSPSFSSINDQIVHCYIDIDNNPNTLYSFLGGSKFTKSTVIKKQFNQIPKGYKKSVSFYVLFYGIGNPSNLQVKINTNLARIDSQQTIVQNQQSCSGSGTQQQNIFYVNFVTFDYQNTFDLEIQSSSDKWGIRELNIEISKCHPTCNSCKTGGSIDDCTSCNSSQTVNKFQCNCPFGQYAKYQNCFDIPCVVCSLCSVQKCEICEDITGNCVQCVTGYIIMDGQCIQNSSCITKDIPYLNFCGVKEAKEFSHLKKGCWKQYTNYWTFGNDSQLLDRCEKNKICAPRISQNQMHQLKYLLPNYLSYHYQLKIDIDIVVDSIDYNNDYVVMYDRDQLIFKKNLYYDKTSDYMIKKTITYSKDNAFFDFKFISNTDGSNEDQTFSQIDFSYIRCHPMCKSCIGSTSADCKNNNCIDNAFVTSGNCQCKTGYYFSLIRFPLNQNFPGSCLKCNSSCKSCTGPSYSQCQKCADGYSSDGKVCKYNCQDGKFWNQATSQCLSCHSCCRTCEGNQSNQCNDCFSGFSFRITDKSCLLYNAECQPCAVASTSLCGGTPATHINCLISGWIVFDANTCVQCGKFVKSKCGGEYSQTIIDFCQVKKFQFNDDTKTCISCGLLISGNCGSLEIQDSCKKYGWKQFDDNTCIDCNPNSPTFSNCVCDSSCSTCSKFKNPLYCLTCKPSLYLFKESQCIPKCPNGYIIDGLKCVQCNDKQMPTCVNCYRTCLTCDTLEVTSVANTCTSCSTTRNLMNKLCQCLDPEDTRELFYECSYQNIAVLNAFLSNLSPLLTINFGKELVIPNNFQSNVYSSTLCNYLFTDQTKQLLGKESKCMISSKYIYVELDDNSQIFDGDPIYFEKNKLSFNTTKLILIDKYYNNIVVQSQIKEQTKVQFEYLITMNYCKDIKIKFKKIENDAKRGFKSFKWSLKSLLPDDQTLQTQLEKIFQKTTSENKLDLLIVQGLIKSNVQLKIRLDYTLKANVTGYEEFDLSVKEEKKIFIDTESTTTTPFYRHQSAIIVFSIFIKICDPIGDRYTIEPLNITISSDQLPEKSYKNQNYLKQGYHIELQPYTFQTGQILFKVNAKLVSDQFIEQQISYGFEVKSSNLYVKIVGENGFFNHKKQAIINGLVRDYDIQSETDPQGIDIKWKCTDPSKNDTCKNKNNELITFNQTLTVIIPEFSFTPYTVIKLSLFGKKPKDRNSTDEITILFSEFDLPSLGVQLDTSDPIKETINLNEELFMKLNYNTVVNVDLLSYSGTIQYKNDVVGIIKFDYTSLRFQIWNYYNDFKRDQVQFQIRFNVFNPQYYMPSMFLATFNINFPPYKCKFTVIPNIGYSVETKFIMQFSDCEDENKPINYQFFYYQSPEEFEYEKKNPLQVKRRQLNDKSEFQFIETLLPAGQILVLAQAIDSKKAIFNTTLEINVQLKNIDESAYLFLIQQKLDQVNIKPSSITISDLLIISDDILKRNELKSSSSLNSKKIEMLNLLDALQKNLSPLSPFSITADKAKTSLTQSGIAYSLTEPQNILTQLIEQLDDSSNLKQSYLEISKEKLKQKIYDSFQVVDTFGDKDSNTQSSQKLVELTNKIGSYLFKNILPNEDPIYFQGKQIKVFGTQMTEKYICSYFVCESIIPTDNTKQASIYNFKKSEYFNNPFSQDDTFLNYTNSLKEQNVSIATFPIIAPTISNPQNDPINTFQKSTILNFPIQQQNIKNNVTCLQQKSDKGWTKNGCSNFFQESSNSYLCICKELLPTTVIDDLEELIKNKNLKTAFSSEGVSNLMNFSDFYKYVAIWLLAFKTILFIVFYFYGEKLDSSYSQSKQFQQQKLQKNENLNNPEQVSPKQIKYSKSKIVPQDMNQNDIEQKKAKEQKNELIKDEEQEVLNDPSTFNEQQIDYHSQKSTITVEGKSNKPQIVQNIEIIQIKPEKNNTLVKSKSLEICESDKQLNEKQEEQNEIQNNQNSEEINNRKNSNQMNTITSYPNKFNSLPKLKQVIIFHNFFGIFYLFNSKLPRRLRFLMFYQRAVQSLCIAIVFDKNYSFAQNVATAIFNALSILIILKCFQIGFQFKNKVGQIVVRLLSFCVISVFYYIILSIVSGEEPAESNKFLITYFFFFLIDIFVISVISTLIQRTIALTILQSGQDQQGVNKILFNLLSLKQIQESIQ